MQPKRAFAILLRVTAAVILLVAVVPLLPRAEIILRDPRLGAWMGLLLAASAAAALFALAWLVGRDASAPPEVSAALARITQQLMELDVKLRDLSLMSDRAARSAMPSPQPQKDHTAQLDQLTHAVAELRELSMLPDAERTERLRALRAHKKAIALKDLFGMVAAHDWPHAERLLIGLEAEYPNDSEVAKGRSYLDHSRKLFEDETLIHSSREIEDLVAAGSWDRALEKATLLVQGFPGSGDAHALLERVKKEQETYQETTAARMFEEIRHDIDRRMWRRALMHAEHLLEKFPTHRLADRIHMQLSTLQENAEIQERQELEVRIQELIHDHEFDEAIELAEDVVRRFPLSPQAESLEKLLPRIRELAREGVQPSASE